MRLDGKIILVTGAAFGFGKCMADRFVAEGAKVTIADLNGGGGHKVAEAIGRNAIAVRRDVSKPEDVAAAVAKTESAFGAPHIVFNNAGWSTPNRPLMETDESTIRKMYDINVFSIFHMTRVMVPIWRQAGGGVMINVGSTAGIRPRPGLRGTIRRKAPPTS